MQNFRTRARRREAKGEKLKKPFQGGSTAGRDGSRGRARLPGADETPCTEPILMPEASRCKIRGGPGEPTFSSLRTSHWETRFDQNGI